MGGFFTSYKIAGGIAPGVWARFGNQCPVLQRDEAHKSRHAVVQLQYIALKALKWYHMLMVCMMMSGVVTAQFNLDTATVKAMELHERVMVLINVARDAAKESGIRPADEAAIIEELVKQSPSKMAAKMASQVGPLLGKLDPKRLEEGNRVIWCDSQQGLWCDDDSARTFSMPTEARPMQVKLAEKKTGHTWWAEVEDVQIVPEQPKEPAPSGPMKKLKSLSKVLEVDDQLFNIPPNYSSMWAQGTWSTLRPVGCPRLQSATQTARKWGLCLRQLMTHSLTMQ